MTLRDRISFPSSAEKTERSLWRLTWRLAAKALFVVVAISLALYSVAATSALAAIGAALMLGLMIRAAFPTERLKIWLRSYWTGEAGDRWRRRFGSAFQTIKTRLHRTASIIPGISGP